MIFWTLSSCVLLALSPAVLAVMEIDANCNTTQPEGPDLPAMQDAIIDIYTHIPVLGDIIGIAKDVIDIFNARNNEEAGFGKQWENCIKGWISAAIDKKSKDEILKQLDIMATKMNRTIMPSINDEYISRYDFDEINRDLHDLHSAADQIRIKTAGVKEHIPDFLIPYNAALAMDLLASKLFTQKLNETIFDPRYKSLVLQNIGAHLLQRMDEYKDELNRLDDDLKDYRDGGWGIMQRTSGHCHDNWGGFNWNLYECHITDPTRRTGGNFDCETFPTLAPPAVCPGWCNYAKCSAKFNEMNAKRDHVQKNVRELFNGMKTSVGTARKYFDGLAHPKNMELTQGTYCDSGCRNSEYHVSCIKDCRLVPNED